MTALSLQAWAATDRGRVRPQNEDSFLVDLDLGLFVVADGMGGFDHGDVASELACSAVREVVSGGRELLDAHAAEPGPVRAARVESLLHRSVLSACQEVFRASTTLAGREGRLGTTIDAVLVSGGVAFTAHVGDGRIVLVRGGEARRLTRDHTVTQERVARGLSSPEEARAAPDRNVITRAVGVFSSVLVDMLRLDLVPGDRVLLCTDGLHRTIRTAELGPWLHEHDVPSSAADLVALANGRGGKDNITALLVATGPLPRAGAPPSDRLELLRRCQLFSACTWRELAQVAAACELRRHPARTAIFREGAEGRECLIVASGAVRIQHGETVLATLGPGDYFGELSMLDEPRRSATAMALEECELLALDGHAFQQLVRLDAALGAKVTWHLLRHLTRMVRTTTSRMPRVEPVALESGDLQPLD